MKQKYRLYRRDASGRYYLQNNITGQQESLGTSDRAEALRLLCARNEADHQPAFNAHLARTYLSASDPLIGKRSWRMLMEALVASKSQWTPTTQERYKSAIAEPALASILDLALLETRPEHFLEAIQRGTVSTNILLRRAHNFAIEIRWLPWPIMTTKQWPPIRFGERRGITREEHEKIVAREKDPERRAFYELIWHVGAAQIDLANLTAENVDWQNRTISYFRRKTRKIAVMRFGDEVAGILKRLPTSGPLFPNWSKLTSAQRADRFHSRCQTVRVSGVSLHSYRYAWAERAMAAGYPERFAQESLGHSSATIHRAYAKKARVEVPPLEEYERQQARMFPSRPSESAPSDAATQ